MDGSLPSDRDQYDGASIQPRLLIQWDNWAAIHLAQEHTEL